MARARSGKAVLEADVSGSEPAGGTARQVDEAPDLGALLESLGTDVVELVAAPGGLDVAVGEPVIYDESEHSSIAPGAVVLAIGVRAGMPEAAKLLLEAEQAGASAVIFKRGGDPSNLSRAAASAGVAVLSVPEEMTWTQLHGFLLNARWFSQQVDGGDGIAGVPIGDLFALANAIAGMVGGAVTIEDPARRVLAFSTLGDQPIDAARRSSILGRQVPDSPGMRKLYRRVLETEGVMTADRDTLLEVLEGGLEELEDLEPRSAVAIRAGGRMIGSIWVAHPIAPLDEDSLHALTEAARIAAPHVIQARAARDVERRMRGEMLLAVLEGRASAEENATRLGFAANARFTVLAYSAAAGEEIDRFERERLVDLVGVYCEALHGPSGSIGIGKNVYALLQAEEERERARVIRVARETQAHASARIGGGVLAAVSSTVDGLREVAAARREAERVLAVLGSGRDARTLATIEDVRSQVVLLELSELKLEHPSLTRGKLTAVLEHDTERGTQYALTLRAYLDAMGDVVGAAARISVHPNTFRYRLRRVVELFDIDLKDAEERLVLELQLRLLGDDGR
jgi:DNA-binding PucR family transcriptional regulator